MKSSYSEENLMSIIMILQGIKFQKKQVKIRVKSDADSNANKIHLRKSFNRYKGGYIRQGVEKKRNDMFAF